MSNEGELLGINDRECGDKDNLKKKQSLNICGSIINANKKNLILFRCLYIIILFLNELVMVSQFY